MAAGIQRSLAAMQAWGREITQSARVALAVKAAIAAAVAWLLAPLVPFADSQYAYYAPLGVLVSMYPTVAGSLRGGTQSLLGLALGILIGVGALQLVFAGLPAVVAIAVVIALGITLGGISALGAGRDWVAMAALFVLLLSGSQVEDFSVSYLLTMGFGVAIGVVTNLLVLPPLYLGRAARHLSEFRDEVSTALRSIAQLLAEGVTDPARFEAAIDGIDRALDSAIAEAGEASESARVNPRGRRRRGDQRTTEQRMSALEKTTRATFELADLLARRAGLDAATEAARSETLVAAIRAAADVVAAAPGDEASRSLLATAFAAVDRAIAEMDRLPNHTEDEKLARAYSFAAVISVRRIAEAAEGFVEAVL